MRYLLVIGSNHRRAQALRLAARRLAEAFTVIAHAGPLPTRDASGPARYLNAAAIIASDAPPEKLREILRAIEREAGRDRRDPRCVLDIDLVARLEGLRVAEACKPGDLDAAYTRPLLDALGIVRN